jgi:hypothetical protein
VLFSLPAAEPRSGGAAFFDYVVNVAAETAHGKPTELYQKMVDGAARLAAGEEALVSRCWVRRCCRRVLTEAAGSPAWRSASAPVAAPPR